MNFVFTQKADHRDRPFVTWRLPESNWGHTDFQSVALPAELKRLNFLNLKYRDVFCKLNFYYKGTEGQRKGTEVGAIA